MPPHRHLVRVNIHPENAVGTPQTGYMITESGPERLYTKAPEALSDMHSDMVSYTGEGAPHDNMSPYINLNYIIALRAEYPPHS